MKKLVIISLLVALVAALAGSQALAGKGADEFEARLSGYEETPQTLSSHGFGSFEADLDEDAPSLSFELTFGGLRTAVSAAHIHFGARATSGGVSAFLCGGGGQPACPPAGGTVTGTITPANILGPAGQGIAPGEFDELIAAMRAGVTYANVHTTQFPGGEIRGQIAEE
jgi:CHRD domain